VAGPPASNAKRSLFLGCSSLCVIAGNLAGLRVFIAFLLGVVQIFVSWAKHQEHMIQNTKV
jgi:hypothetical protein